VFFAAFVDVFAAGCAFDAGPFAGVEAGFAALVGVVGVVGGAAIAP
jgi:hypothetical protein